MVRASRRVVDTMPPWKLHTPRAWKPRVRRLGDPQEPHDPRLPRNLTSTVGAALSAYSDRLAMSSQDAPADASQRLETDCTNEAVRPWLRSRSWTRTSTCMT
jgi:hypothetical protein